MKQEYYTCVRLAYRPADAIHALGSKKIYYDCLAAGWLRPVVDEHKLRLFRHEDVLSCYKRLSAGETPFSPPAEEASEQ